MEQGLTRRVKEGDLVTVALKKIGTNRSEKRRRFRLLPHGTANLNKRMKELSCQCPLAKGIIGLALNEEIEIDLPGGKVKARLLRIGRKATPSNATN